MRLNFASTPTEDLPVETHPPLDPARGIANLFDDCMGLAAGQQLLIVAEPEASSIYSAELVAFVAAAARERGLTVDVVRPALIQNHDAVPAALLALIARADHCLFLSRIGDVLRFQPLPGTGGKAICYALDMAYLGSAFATVPQGDREAQRSAIVARIAQARHCTIQCANGTDLQGTLAGRMDGYGTAGDFTVRNFPTMVIPPIPAESLSGRLVLDHALTSTGLNSYADDVIPLPARLELTIEDGRIVDLAGPPTLRDRARAQFERVATLFGGEAWRINSWHAGINEGTFFAGDSLHAIERWSSIAFGSPRYLHFHMCGHAPGDICGQIFDPTVRFDGAAFWDAGRLAIDAVDPQRSQRLPLGLPQDRIMTERNGA